MNLDKQKYLLFVIQHCGTLNYAEIHPDHEYIIYFLIGCRKSQENTENQ